MLTYITAGGYRVICHVLLLCKRTDIRDSIHSGISVEENEDLLELFIKEGIHEGLDEPIILVMVDWSSKILIEFNE